MNVLGFKIECHMDGASVPLVAITDQRDVAAWEASEAWTELASSQTRTRHYAYTALKRSGQISMTWTKFNTEACVQAMVIEVIGADELAEEAEDGADDADPS